MNTKKVKPLIIGIGLAGERHLQAQLDLGNEVGIYTQDPQKIEKLREKSGVVFFDNFEKAIDWSNLVHVCTPDNMHTKYVAKAIEKGRAVLCEKPFTTNPSEALELQNLAHKHDSVLVVGQNYRLTPSFLETRKRVQEGQLGTITAIETTYLHDMTSYRMGTSARNVQDFLYVGGSHAIDLAVWITAQEVVSVQANVGTKTRDEYACQERYQIILRFASGILGHVSLDASTPRPMHGSDVVVNGQDGSLTSHNKVDALYFYRKGEPEVESINLPNTKTPTTIQEVKILNDFLKGKRDSYWPLPGVDEAVTIVRILDAIHRAVVSGQTELINQ